MHTDNGTEFKGAFEDVLNEYGIKKTTSDPYQPEENGKIERFWATLETRLPKINGITDYSKLDDVIFAYNYLHKHAALKIYDVLTPISN